MLDLLQIIADMIHLLSYAVLIRQIIHNKSVHEVSYRTQEIFLVVYIFRYGDIFWNRISIYLTIMKITYICLTIYIIYLVRFKKPYCLGYDQHTDSFKHYLYIYPAVLVVTIFVHTYSEYHPFFEFCWSFSIWLESVALIPQIYVIYQKREVEVITGQYMFLVGAYRLFYILKWYSRDSSRINILISTSHLQHIIKLIAAIIQLGVFLDFAYYYLKSTKMSGSIIQLPV